MAITVRIPPLEYIWPMPRAFEKVNRETHSTVRNELSKKDMEL